MPVMEPRKGENSAAVPATHGYSMVTPSGLRTLPRSPPRVQPKMWDTLRGEEGTTSVELPGSDNSDPDQAHNHCHRECLSEELLRNFFAPCPGRHQHQEQRRNNGKPVQWRFQG